MWKRYCFRAHVVDAMSYRSVALTILESNFGRKQLIKKKRKPPRLKGHSELMNRG